MSNYTLKIKKYLLLMFFITGCLGVGFSSWLFGNGNNDIKTNIETNFGDVNKFEYKDSAYYIKNSESGFEYYIFNNIYYYVKSSLSLKIVLYPSKISSYFSDDTYISVAISYSYNKNVDFDIFSGSNPNIIAPTKFVCSIENNATYFMDSTNLIFTKNIDKNDENKYCYKLAGDILLFSKDKPSLYSLCSRFSNSNNYLVLDVFFNFNIINSVEISNDLNYLNFRFQTSMDGIQL